MTPTSVRSKRDIHGNKSQALHVTMYSPARSLVSYVLTSWFSWVLASRNGTAAINGGLHWNNLSVQTSDGKFLLHNCHGFIPDGHLCGILGPSGAGKSTTLSALGGTMSHQSGLKINGDILYFNSSSQSTELLRIQGGDVAWLQQKDEFFNMLTVEETLDLAAFLELPRYTDRQRRVRVQRIMESLGMTKLRHCRIGDSALNYGLSGGEKRRLSLALELLSSPKLFIADEPTSGLDSTLSEKVIRLIKMMVKEREIPAILSLHQPRSSIWRMLDSVMLLAPGGRLCYFGSTHDAVPYFASLGYQCPPETNPSEYLLDLVSVDSEDPRAAGEDEARIMKLSSAFAERQNGNVIQIAHVFPTTNDERLALKELQPRPLGLRHVGKRFGRLLLRSWRQNTRNYRVNILRLFVSVGNAFLFTNVFKSVKKGIFTAKSVADRTALLTFGVINMTMMALMKTIDLFAREKPVVRREQQRNQYSSLEYLLSKSIAEIPLDTVFATVFTWVLKYFSGIRIGWRYLTATFALMTVSGASLGFAIGAASPTGETAMTMAIPVMVLLMSVGIINPSGVDPSEAVPLLVDALKALSPVNYAIRAVCIKEFSGAKFDSPNGKQSNIFLQGRRALQDLPKMGALALVKNGDQVLTALGLGDKTYEGAMWHLVHLSLANLFISWIGLNLIGPSCGSQK